MRRLLRASIAASLAVLLTSVSCVDAPDTVQGGQALISEEAGAPTWSSLYADFFGPSGQASCTAQSACHGDSSQLGAQTSGFVCGATKESCRLGMTQGIAPDAGGFFCPIVCVGSCPQNGESCAQIVTSSTQLAQALHKTQASGLNNMPCGGNLQTCPSSGSTYTFTSDDLARISTWIQQGAQDN